ncbi:serine hydrolase [Methylocapsa sp. D3K7]|uniref:serine hydrolase n=1 Tax=Methylocapsa sp. D3K7 TaxID=3041435 RepID=UPI00244E78C9|nr:serine hydrolase [Methylocapsa sp. D3K7]WGJ14770.1 serine hydrolase [Methylocapsa sp. D3K7]
MTRSRREFLKTAAATTTLTSIPLAAAADATNAAGLPAQTIGLFEALPGDKALKIYAPTVGLKPGILIQSNASKMLFVASAIKTFVLCTALRQIDSPDIVHTLEDTELTLDDTVWSFGSPAFNPPNLTGVVSERTTLEAMITRSDNTATDMAFKLAGANNVRAFIAAAGLKNTLVPDSTRALTGYLFGAANYKTVTWAQLLQVVQGPIVHPFLNSVETLASSADDLTSYYSRALQGAFFQHAETLNEFRRILTLCDFIYLVPLPLGVSAYAKSGNADFPSFHARSIAGGMFFSGRWVYFAFIINWYAANQDDSQTVNAFFAAIHLTLTRIRDRLSV